MYTMAESRRVFECAEHESKVSFVKRCRHIYKRFLLTKLIILLYYIADGAEAL